MLLGHPGIPRPHPDVHAGDIQQLAHEGLLRLEVSTKGDWKFEVTPRGFRHYRQLKGQQTGTAARMDQAVRSYLESSGMAQRHPEAITKLREADRLLWSVDSPNPTSTIGHLCREAVQAFATSLLRKNPVPGASKDLAKPKLRVGAVLAGLPVGSEAVRKYVEALGNYWETVVDLAERQEHAGLKEGEPLTWEDSRRLVFATLFAMTEIDRCRESSG
jgi:hypothetical protein